MQAAGVSAGTAAAALALNNNNNDDDDDNDECGEQSLPNDARVTEEEARLNPEPGRTVTMEVQQGDISTDASVVSGEDHQIPRLTRSITIMMFGH